jgi:hypothetical protein
MSVSRALLPDEPLMIAWEAYRGTPDYANTLKWALDVAWIEGHPERAAGQLWGAFMAGWIAAGGKIDPR